MRYFFLIKPVGIIIDLVSNNVKVMKKTAFLGLFLITALVSAQTTISKHLGDFSTLKVYNGIDVELIKSNEQKLEITGEKAEKVKVKNDGVTLKILLRFPETTADKKVYVKLYFKDDIQIIDANEGATITGKGFKQQKIEVKVQEGAFMNLVVDIKHLKVKSSSGGVLKLSGVAKNQVVNVDLGGVYHGYNLTASEISIVKAASGAKAEIQASETLDLKVSFGGSIFYKGSPEVLKTKKVIGGIIEQRS
ncbi:conserved hypothetical protein [Tenacibaculum maritimum]|uniref:Putative auto-transporter adhesin head GIN domain-containing protein n=2 Tax=Tenacibaculum maritimum TaxID=107401 RepID=A0A2H1E5L3_9FLAO|nr:conserved hypothetical protein [Tenacibaculum maritimum]CAA0183083.1 conserved hypothetical protein [Tenacibaculum maritimum]CAA0221628.1 conserved hypothetical protein [Tenacibaculum maritimum]SFZ79925.1 conserved protein of unknown function [Tenacibaculum maritimum NCIMB 2154]